MKEMNNGDADYRISIVKDPRGTDGIKSYVSH